MIKDEIENLLFHTVRAINASLKSEDIHLEHPEVGEHGDYATNVAMQLAKTLKKPPLQIAEEIVKNLPKSEWIERVEVVKPGFINFFLSEAYFQKELELIQQKRDVYGEPEKLSLKKISVEHTQVNPNKEPHVGHLRNAVIGDSLVQILSFIGNKVVTLYYQNDLGQQVASILLAYKKQWVKREDFPTLISWASKAYADVESKLTTNNQQLTTGTPEHPNTETVDELRQEKERIQVEIAKQDTPEAREAREITDEILKETLQTFQKLGIEYDCIVRESDIVRAKLWEQTFELLKKNPAFYLAEDGEKKGCWLLKVPGSEDKIIVRSNGVPNYAGVDIANHLWKFGRLPDFEYEKLDWETQEKPLYTTSINGEERDGFSQADSIVNIIDTTQTYPQQSVIEALRVLGFEKEASNYHHVNYGFVYLSPKTAKQLGFEVEEDARQVKMSGRKGTVVSVEAFLTKIEGVLRDKFGEFESISAVRNGAIKFELLKYNTYQDIVFDLDAALDINGFSGPYIQYAYTRATSVLQKAIMSEHRDLQTPENQDVQTQTRLNQEEKNVLRTLYQFPEVVERVAKEFSPHYLCTYLFELSQVLNAFYNAHRIIGSETEAWRLKLTEAAATVLSNGLRLLGIEAPEKM